MNDLTTLDSIVLAVLAVATARGAYIGLIREGFSIVAIGGGLIAIRYGVEPISAILDRAAGETIGPTASMWLAGIALGFAVVAIIGALGRLARRGARAVGLGFADRAAGAVVGSAEGALLAAVILIGAIWIAPDSPLVTRSKSVEVLEEVQIYLAEHSDDLPQVAAPWPE